MHSIVATFFRCLDWNRERFTFDPCTILWICSCPFSLCLYSCCPWFKDSLCRTTTRKKEKIAAKPHEMSFAKWKCMSNQPKNTHIHKHTQTNRHLERKIHKFSLSDNRKDNGTNFGEISPSAKLFVAEKHYRNPKKREKKKLIY